MPSISSQSSKRHGCGWHSEAWLSKRSTRGYSIAGLLCMLMAALTLAPTMVSATRSLAVANRPLLYCRPQSASESTVGAQT
jgi:hypothetical protein